MISLLLNKKSFNSNYLFKLSNDNYSDKWIVNYERRQNYSKVSILSSNKGYWNDINNQRQFLDSISKDLKMKTHDDWYKLTAKDIRNKGGYRLMQIYSGSLYKALQKIYPEHSWKLSEYDRVPVGYWTDVDIQKQFLESIFRELEMKTLDDWYKVSTKEVRDRGGYRLMDLYSGSLMKALQLIYPQHKWDISKFSKVSNGFWNNINNQRELFDSIGSELGIKKLDDWYSIKSDLIDDSPKLSSIITHTYSSSLMKALQAIYPEHLWENSKFSHVSMDTGMISTIKGNYLILSGLSLG